VKASSREAEDGLLASLKEGKGRLDGRKIGGKALPGSSASGTVGENSRKAYTRGAGGEIGGPGKSKKKEETYNKRKTKKGREMRES